MWRLILIVNTLLMGVFSLLSAVSMMPLYNNYVCYQNNKPLPFISYFALGNLWIYKVIFLLWLLGLIFLWRRFKGTSMPVEYVQLHTAVTLLVGVLMLALFCLAGILPFIPITVGLSR